MSHSATRFLRASLAGAAGAAFWPALAAADALSTPAMSPTLAANASPAGFDAGPLGKIYVTGAVTGLGMAQTNSTPGESDGQLDLSNAQIFIQNTSGPVQFFIEAGDYAFPTVGAPYTRAFTNARQTYSLLPVAYLKLQPDAEWSIQIGKLPTLIGVESGFTFQNMNIERGLLWNQEPVVSEGVQINYSKGPVTFSGSLNDGFYSHRWNWLSGLATYTLNPKDSVTLSGGGSLSGYTANTTATPLIQNNSAIVELAYTHTEGPWSVTPYVQWTRDKGITVDGVHNSGGDTWSGALLLKYSFTSRISLAARAEYLATTADICHAWYVDCAQTNVLYGPGSSAVSLTLTPTYQKGVFFVRGEGSYVGAISAAQGAAFGPEGESKSQFRGVVETGVLF